MKYILKMLSDNLKMFNVSVCKILVTIWAFKNLNDIHAHTLRNFVCIVSGS